MRGADDPGMKTFLAVPDVRLAKVYYKLKFVLAYLKTIGVMPFNDLVFPAFIVRIIIQASV